MIKKQLKAVLVLVLAGVLSLENSDAGGRHSGVLDLPWKDELCCESRPASTVEGASAPAERPNGSNRSLPHDSQCSFKNLTSKLHPLEFSGTCLDILCGIDEKWENVTCHLEPHALPLSLPDAGHMAVSLQLDSEEAASDPPVFCEAEDSFTCSVALDAESSFHAVVTVTIADARAPSVLLRVPARPVKPAPPVNLSHVQTIEAELILHWGDPKDIKTDLLQYEVRYSPDTIHPAWQVMSVSGDTKTSLDLKACVNYTVQVRRSSRSDPPLWSGWSESHHIFLDEVSYIPEKVVVKAGENVTVYCVFNDHNFNASTALWTLNFDQELDYSLYHPINQWVSQVTMRPSETGMYDLLQCTKKRMIAYSQVYVEGASISISCETNGEIDAMDCRWNSTQWLNPNFRTRWADLSCDVMEERERAGDNVGHEGPSCLQVDSRKRLCTIQPLRTNCYKLWLEVSSHLGLIRSKPVYLTPNDHVKPHTPTDVKAVSRSGGVLNVTWKRPYLPVEVQCQFRYHSPSADHPKPDWKVQAIVREPWAEVNVSDVCRVFVVQVRCMHISGAGYWSEWSPSVYSSPQNSRAPERGPNFWRFLQDDPHRKQTNVTLLFKDLQTSGQPYCVEGFLVKRLGSTGPVQEPILMQSSYSFEWNQMPQTVTVEAFNSLGSSSDNINMTLEKSPKRRCVHHFSVTVINSTCVSLSWTLIDKSSPPIFMVVQWSLCPAGVTDSSAQSSVIYTAVLLCGPKQQQQHHHLHDKDCSCSSSSDEGNFSANNSDISASFNGGLWELDVPRRSCCYNSTEELSEKPEQGDRDVGEEKDLYYIGADYGDEDEESEEELNAKIIQTVPLNSEGCSAESRRLLELTESKCDFSPLYLPQFRTAPSCTRQLSAKPQEGRCHP
uniref:Leptin receptor n=1 Tax=Takifugu rubripes TaxID=31033 RepID=A0A674MP25_TAKRU